MKNQEKDLKNENSDNTERKLTKEELTALCRRVKKHRRNSIYSENGGRRTWKSRRENQK